MIRMDGMTPVGLGKGRMWLCLVVLSGFAFAGFAADPAAKMAGKSRQSDGGADGKVLSGVPTLAGGVFKGFSIAYTGPNYDFVMDSNGMAVVYIKEQGEKVGKPLPIRFGCQFHDKERGGVGHARRITGFTVFPEPAVTDKPLDIRLVGKFEDDVLFRMKYHVAETGFSITGECQDPPFLDDPSLFAYNVAIASTHKPTGDMKMEEIKALMPDWTVAVKPVERPAVTHPYWKGLKTAEFCEQVVIRGPWAKRIVTIKTTPKFNSNTKSMTRGHFVPYPGMPAYSGFYVGRRGRADGCDMGEVVVSIK